MKITKHKLKIKTAEFVDKVAKAISDRVKLSVITLYHKNIIEKFGYYKPRMPVGAGRILIIEADNYIITISAGSSYILDKKKCALEKTQFGAIVYVSKKMLQLKPNKNGTKLDTIWHFNSAKRIDIRFKSGLKSNVNKIIDIINKIEPINTQEHINKVNKEHSNTWFTEEEYSNYKFKPINNLYIVYCKFHIDHKGIGTINIPNIKVRFSGLISVLNKLYHTIEIQVFFDLKKKKIFNVQGSDITNQFDNPMVIFKALKVK